MPDMPVEMSPSLTILATWKLVSPCWSLSPGTAAALERLEQRQPVLIDRIDHRQEALIDRMDRRFDAIDRWFEALDGRYDSLVAHQRSDFLWLLAMNVATIGSLLTAMARGFHRL